jgi:hypothetical protein
MRSKPDQASIISGRTMQIFSKAPIAAGFALLFSLNASAADIAPTMDNPASAVPDARTQQDIRKEMRQHWEKMSPKEREQVRNKMNDNWKNMSPQEREARRKEMREHFKNMSPEERKQFNSDMGKLDSDYPSDSKVKTERTTK